MIPPVFQQLGLAVLLGLLVGLQRERARPSIAGIRTFALTTLLGTICALLGERFGDWLVAAGLLAVGALFAIGYLARIKTDAEEPGLTTEIAGILMYGIGAYLVIGSLPVAVVCGGVVAVLLQWKQPLHRFVAQIGEDDLKAIMQFVLITLVILPVLPNRTFGPYGVLNPFKIWLMVVLIVGMGLVGYILYQVIGKRAGLVLGGLLGGIISSTATTASYARLARTGVHGADGSTLVIMLASTVVFGRVLVEIAAVAPNSFRFLAPPVVALLLVCSLISLWSFRRNPPPSDSDLPAQVNPAELKPALIFGGLYALVLLAVAFGKSVLGQTGLYAVAIISGLTDMDAITLSTAQLVETGKIQPTNGWRLIVLASLANLVFKAGIVLAAGHRGLSRRIALRFGLAVAGGALILWLWPA